MRRALLAGLAAAFALSAGVAVAGGGLPNDDDNDYEGRIEKNEETYFGFDLSNDGKRVSGITAQVHYQCESGKNGTLLVESDGGLKVKDGKFSGKTSAESKLDPLTYTTSGTLGEDGKAKGTFKAKGFLGGSDPCRADNDGDWKAKEGRDIDVILMPRG